MRRVLLGDKVDTNAPVINLTEPVGSFNDPGSKITPFKIMKGIQPVDAGHEYIIVPHLSPRDENDTTSYWKHLDWEKAIVDGMNAAKLDYSGAFKWEGNLDVLAVGTRDYAGRYGPLLRPVP